MDPRWYNCWLPDSRKARMGDMCRRVINIMLALCTHFLSTQTALLTLNIDPFPSLTVILLVWLAPPLRLLTNVPLLSTQKTKPVIHHQQKTEIYMMRKKTSFIATHCSDTDMGKRCACLLDCHNKRKC